MSKHYDAIVIGGGHNGLACATLLAKAGKRIILLEANKQLGGLGATREFAPGFKASVAHTLPQMTETLVNDLDLKQYGFELAARSLKTIALSPEGQHITIGNGKISGGSDKDAASYRDYLALLQKFATALNGFWHKTPPVIGSGGIKNLSTLGLFGWKLRTMGKDDMREMMRMIALPAQDLMDEYFDSPLLKGALSWDANVGSKLAPRSPNNAVLALLYKMAGDLDGQNTLPLPKGGVGGLIDAMAKSAISKGVEIRAGARVANVIVEAHVVKGVTLENGETLSSSMVISNADPKTSFFKLLGAQHLDVQFTHRINRLRTDGFVAKVHLALNGLPSFKGLDKADGRLMLTPTMKTIENAYDEAKYGGYAKELPMEIVIPTIHDSSLAESGKHVLSAQVQYAPYKVKGGWDLHRDQFLENVISTLEQYAPDIRSLIEASELLTPADLEKQFNVTGGHWHHAEFAIDTWWMNRPTYGASQYKTPMPGFYLCGAGAHPGGGIMGAAGTNAAKAILEEK